MKILFLSSEGLPYSKTGGLADVVQALPKALADMGHEVAVLLPRYRGNKNTSILVSSVTVTMGDQLRFPAIAEGAAVGGVRYFFVVDRGYFDREQLYGEKGVDYPDNAERFTEYCRTAIEFVKRVWLPDVIHCHDWQTALVPLLMRTQYGDDPVTRNLPVVLTIHNLAYQGMFPRSVLKTTGLPESLFTYDRLEFYGNVNFLKGGILFADCLSTVSRRYALEIQTPEYGSALDGVIRERSSNLVGIFDGVDYAAWSPETDTFIAEHYSAQNLEGKRVCKKDLLQYFKLPADKPEHLERPLVGIVSRFADQKGFDLIAQISAELMQENLSLVVLGTGQGEYERLFRGMAEKYPARVGLKIGYDNALAHKIEAGADLFLMPSRYEPSGLNQMYSLKYGTVPVVRATGGLDDTIQDFDPNTNSGTGFKFDAYSGQALLESVRRALGVYREPKVWQQLQKNGMAKDFSWKASAAAYVTLYEAAKRSRIPKVVVTSEAVAHRKLDQPDRRPEAPQGNQMADSIQAVTDANFETDVIEASKTQPVMVDFWADWCRPCHMLSPTVEEVARENAGKLKVVKLNVDENSNAAGKFNIRGIPTLLVFKGGQVADQLVGAVPKDQITKVIQRHITA